ncbi:MAG: DUF1834 family protein [Nitrospirae bacterium]|nr:DUF1834 family protein [Nitrospirota bacterium]MCL5237409.1 DUF1834 family protein [Nitrospirota bacterium]
MDRKVIEDAMINALKQGMPYLKYADTYQGELDEKSIAQFVVNFPAVLVYMEKTKYTNRGYPKKWQDLEFTLLVCDKNLRGNKVARQGDLSNPGTYKMLDDVFSALFCKTLGLDIEEFDIDSEEALINSPRVSVYAAVYRTKAAKN